MYVAAALAAVALPVGLVSAAGRVSHSQLALPGELLQLVTPAQPDRASAHRAALPRHATAWPTPAARRPGRRHLAPLRAAAVVPTAAEPALVRHAAAPPSPGVALAQPALQPRPGEPAPTPEVVIGPLPNAGAPPLPAAVAAPSPPPVAEAAVSAPPAAVAEPAPAPAATTPAAPSAPVVAEPHHHDEHAEGAEE
jgi:hypothetical protein